MKGVKNTLRAVVWVMCIYHLAAALMMNLPYASIGDILRRVLGATQTPDASAQFLVRMLAGYMLAFGVAMGLAAYDPVKNRALLTVGVVLVIWRSLQRLFLSHDLQSALGITPTMNWTLIAAMLFFAVSLVALRLIVAQELRMGGGKHVA